MACKVKLQSCLAVGGNLKHGISCLPPLSTFRTRVALCGAHSNANYFLTAAVLPDQLEQTTDNKKRAKPCGMTPIKFLRRFWDAILPHSQKENGTPKNKTYCIIKLYLIYFQFGPIVYRLGRWPLTPERGVRFPLGLPFSCLIASHAVQPNPLSTQ